MKMKLGILLLLISVPSLCMSQHNILRQGEEVPYLFPDSPFEHLLPSFAKSSNIKRPFQCPTYLYYQNNNPTSHYYTENLPQSSEWAIRVTPPAANSGATRCTVWTVTVDFELLNSSMLNRDTVRFFVRDAAAPFAIIHQTHFLARAGVNRGEVEIDPPLVAPVIRHSIFPLRDVLVGFKVIGDSSAQAKFRFTTPSLFSSPPRSFKVTPSGLLPASNVVGQSVDLVLEARLCCDIDIPVELSAFSAEVEADAVHLRWRTETETNNFSFELQRSNSPDGPWNTRGFLRGHGSTTLPIDYSYRDPYSLSDFAPGQAPVYWYRLRQHDFDGTINDHPPLQVHLSDLSALGHELSPVYPNPLSASINDYGRIRYRVAEETFVRISIHDMLGRELAVFVNSLHPAGLFETMWAPVAEHGPLRSGSYFIRMQAGASNLVQKVSLVR